MTKGELLKRLDGFDANTDVVFSSDIEEFIDSGDGLSVNSIALICVDGTDSGQIVLLHI